MIDLYRSVSLMRPLGCLGLHIEVDTFLLLFLQPGGQKKRRRRMKSGTVKELLALSLSLSLSLSFPHV